MKPLFFRLLFALFILGWIIQVAHAQATKVAPMLQNGIWRGEIQLQGQTAPFNFEVAKPADKTLIYLINAEDRLKLDEIEFRDDSLHVGLHIYEAELVAKVNGNQWSGYWVKSSAGKEVYRLPFQAAWGPAYRFSERPTQALLNVSGTYDVSFTNAEGKTTPAVGLFTQKGNRLTGTFLTSTGDYRFLEGEVSGNELRLSAFSGEVTYLFKAQVSETGIVGEFWSGRSGNSKWMAKKNAKAALPEADKLTFLKPGYDKLAFSFPDLTGKMVSLADPKYQGKVVIVQILGSWCPNCLDESEFLIPYYNKHKDKGLAIIGLAYERSAKFDEAKLRLDKMTKRLGVTYDILLAGTIAKDNASNSLPMLNHVMAFPTTIYIDRAGKVRKIYTGFSGPSTGKYYEAFVDEFTSFVGKLLKEKE